MLTVKHMSPDTHFARSVFSRSGQGKGQTLTYSQKRKVIVLQTSQTKPDLTEPYGNRAGMTGLLVSSVSGSPRAE